jgi:hypothetical protein
MTYIKSIEELREWNAHGAMPPVVMEWFYEWIWKQKRPWAVDAIHEMVHCTMKYEKMDLSDARRRTAVNLGSMADRHGKMHLVHYWKGVLPWLMT